MGTMVATATDSKTQIVFSLSPEQDAKLFLTLPAPTGVFGVSAVSSYLAAWKSVEGPYWANDYSLLPRTLTTEETSGD